MNFSREDPEYLAGLTYYCYFQCKNKSIQKQNKKQLTHQLVQHLFFLFALKAFQLSIPVCTSEAKWYKRSHRFAWGIGAFCPLHFANFFFIIVIVIIIIILIIMIMPVVVCVEYLVFMVETKCCRQFLSFLCENTLDQNNLNLRTCNINWKP